MKIILFDGVCNLCESSVNFIIKYDTQKHFFFVSQNSDKGKALLKKHSLENIDSLVLLIEGKSYIKSRAVFEIAKYFEGKWRYLAIFRFIPSFLSDGVYDVIAKNRYKIFGKKSHCMVPTPELKSRFL